jgi:2-oxoisovalerate dehydrogenase E2 component (dihydrolipoyl transacylase)
VEITSRYTGIIKKLHYEIGEMARVGNPIVDIEIDSSSEPESSVINSEVSPPSPPAQVQSINITEPEPLISVEKTFTLATPAVRRIAREHNIDIGNIKGTGKNGRITKEDILNYVAIGKEAQAQPSKESNYVLIHLCTRYMLFY